MKYLWIVFSLVYSIGSTGQSQSTAAASLTPPEADTFFMNQRWAEAIPL